MICERERHCTQRLSSSKEEEENDGDESEGSGAPDLEDLFDEGILCACQEGLPDPFDEVALG